MVVLLLNYSILWFSNIYGNSISLYIGLLDFVAFILCLILMISSIIFWITKYTKFQYAYIPFFMNLLGIVIAYCSEVMFERMQHQEALGFTNSRKWWLWVLVI